MDPLDTLDSDLIQDRCIQGILAEGKDSGRTPPSARSYTSERSTYDSDLIPGE